MSALDEPGWPRTLTWRRATTDQVVSVVPTAMLWEAQKRERLTAEYVAELERQVKELEARVEALTRAGEAR